MATAPPPPPPPAPWRPARVETTIKLSTTGGTVWGAAEAAIAFFSRHWDNLHPNHHQRRPLRVLELGAGCGKLGLTLALNTAQGGGCSVLLTEQPGGGALEHLERNVRLNISDGWEGGGAAEDAPRAVACDWADFVVEAAATDRGEDDDDENDQEAWRSCARVSPLPNLGTLPRADVIIGSDLIYLPEGARALPRAIAALLRRGSKARRRASGDTSPCSPLPVAYYAHTRHRFDALDVEFEEQCALCGLELVELDAETGRPVVGGARGEGEGEGGAAAAAAKSASSPPPFTELFPEHRVAIYRLRLAAELGEPEP